MGVSTFHWQIDDKTQSIDMMGVRTGNGGYTIKSTNENIVTAQFIPAWWNPSNEFINSIGIRITYKGMEGEASLVINDSEGLSKTMDVIIE